MKLKYMRLFLSILCCSFMALSIFISPISTIKADDEIFGNDTIVTFGLYSYETKQLEISSPDYFFDHIRYGLAHSIYNYYKTLYVDNTNFPSEVSIFYQRLIDTFGTDFFETLAAQRFLLDVFVNNNQVYLFFNRVPESQVKPTFAIWDNNNNSKSIEMLPDVFGSSYWVLHYGNNTYKCFTSYCPYYYNSNLAVGNNSSYIEAQAKVGYTDLNDVKQSLTNSNLRSFYLILNMSVPALTFTVDMGYYNAYYNSSTLKAFTNRIWSGNLECIMSDFPVYDYKESPISPYITYSGQKTQFYYNRLPYEINVSDKTYIIISGYSDIPQPTPTPTFTPTPQPTWTPYPTATPFPPVNEIEGISQMMSLFTRKYEFNINGNVIGIRPLYLFVFTFLVGAIFKAIQGGDRN